MFESHFQSFTDSADPTHGAARVAALRAELHRLKVDGFMIPRADEYQNEYVPACCERLAWLTGFTGSAGLAIVLKDRAAVFVDGRYTLQVRQQVDAETFEPLDVSEITPERWLESNLPRNARFGFDPWLVTPQQLARYRTSAAAAGATLVALDSNPVDAIWTDRPQPPCAPIHIHPARLAGEASDKKLARIRESFKTDALLISDPHNLAWTFNIRGHDVAHTPIALAYALILKNGEPRLYIDDAKLDDKVHAELSENISLHLPQDLLSDLVTLARTKQSVAFDQASVASKLVQTFEQAGGQPTLLADPITLLKARKNKAELRGAVAAHIRDGAALTSFLAWLDDAAPGGKLSEIEAAQALETFRRATKKLKDVSFPTISGFGPNGASPHYRVTEASNLTLGKGLYLVDSGAQYEDGTTDVTRTIAIGKPTAEMRDRFTRVLKGHIAISRLVFPLGTNGAQIDAFARVALWEVGLDFDHGTGHGVGSYLSVHEGPQRISKFGSCTLDVGMILSNEPAFYKPDAFGIRIENLIVVEPRDILGATRPMLGFQTLTLAPIDQRLIAAHLLSEADLRWLNDYHANVRKILTPLVDAKTLAWLKAATKKITV